MKLYIAINNDSHYDTSVNVFDTPERAIEFARKLAKEKAYYKEDYREVVVNWCLFCVDYSPEEGRIWVVEKVLNDESEGES